MGILGKWKERGRQETTKGVSAESTASQPVPYEAALVEAAATQSRRLQALLGQMAHDRIALGYDKWPGDQPVPLTEELKRHETLAMALQEAAAYRADGKAMRGLSCLQSVATLPGELDEGWLWLLESEQRALKDNYGALHRGLITDLRKQVGEILVSPATAVERLRAEILEVARDTFTRQAAYDAIVTEVGTRADKARERGRWGEAQELSKIVRETAAPWTPQRQRGRWGGLVRRFFEGKPRRQQPSSSSRSSSSHPARPVDRPPRRTEKGERPSSPIVLDTPTPSVEGPSQQGEEP